jgi:hypothetical protein
MHSFTLKTATLAALLIAVPSAGAYARSMVGDPPTMIIDQVQGVDQGIANARQQNTITAAVAQSLHMRAVQIIQAAERTAAEGDGTIPFTESQQLLLQLDNLEQALRLDTGSDFAINDDHSENGNYPF